MMERLFVIRRHKRLWIIKKRLNVIVLILSHPTSSSLFKFLIEETMELRNSISETIPFHKKKFVVAQLIFIDGIFSIHSAAPLEWHLALLKLSASLFSASGSVSWFTSLLIHKILTLGRVFCNFFREHLYRDLPLTMNLLARIM